MQENDEFGTKINPVKIKQEVLESLNVTLKQNPWEQLNVNIWQHILSNIWISNQRWKPFKIQNIDDNYLFTESIDSKITGKALIGLWVIWILYWNNIEVSRLFWTTFTDENNIIWWVILLSIIIELLLFIFIIYRDLWRYKVKNKEIERKNKAILDNFKKQRKTSEIEQKVIDNIEDIKNQKFHKIFLQLWFKAFYPIIIWIIWFKKILESWNYTSITNIFNSTDLIVFCIIGILFILWVKLKLK